MGLRINTNTDAFNAYRNLSVTQGQMSKSLEKLSSGYRINSASDDAAGLGVSESLKARIRSFSVAERNTNNAIGMTRTAEGGLSEVSGIVLRMRELAVQSANGDLTSTDRSYLDTEFQQMKSEIDRVANSTQLNGVDLLGGTSASISFQVGIGTTSNDTIAVSFGGISSTGLEIGRAHV